VAAASPHRTRMEEGGGCRPWPNVRHKPVELEVGQPPSSNARRERCDAGTGKHSANVRYEREVTTPFVKSDANER